MKILIGTPIHQVKDYAMERWLNNVPKLKHPADLLLVDNSPGENYAKKVEAECRKRNLKNFEVKHIELPPEQGVYERVARSREVIRREVINGNYNAWMSWECDQLIPANALNELIRLMEAGDLDVVDHNGWVRGGSGQPQTDFNLALIKRNCLEKYSFILEFGSDPDMIDDWEQGEAWFKQRVLRGGGSYMHAYGVIKPVTHLDYERN